jgi:ABC-type glycerol-3-phosphate transport system substrate-binding protein
MNRRLGSRMNRRKFLRGAVVASVSAPAIIRSVGLSAAGVAAPTIDVTADYVKQHPLYFNVWEFDPDIVQNSVKEFNKEYQENAVLQVLPGDYVTTELNKLIAGSPLNMVYSQSELVKFYKAGFITPLDDLWGLDEIKAATLPVQWEAQTYDGHVLGLPYFHSAKPLVAVNTALAEQVGFKHIYPKSWPELYAMAREAKKSGKLQAPPYLPRWVPTSLEITNMWIVETQNRGGHVFDDKSFAPMFDASTEAAHVLEDWHSLYVDGVVPKSAVTVTMDELIDGMASGQYLYSQQELYDFYRMNDPSRSRMAGKIGFAPYAGNPWGYFNYGLYSLIAQKNQSAVDRLRALRLIRFFGYQNKESQFWVQRQWVLRENLGIGYPSVYNDPDVVAFYKTWQPSADVLGYDFQKEAEAIQANAHKLPIWNSPWYADFNAAAIPILTSIITGAVPVKDGVAQLRKQVETLIDTYQ